MKDLVKFYNFRLIHIQKLFTFIAMRLLFNPPNQIFFHKIEGNKMKGTIEMSNPTSDTIFAFKIKCTNPDLFIVNPLKGLIKAGQKLTIEYNTVDSVNLDFARELVSKHKFLIEFAPVASQLSLPNFKSQQSDRKKYYINMDSIRGSKLFKDNDKMSMHSGISNRMSYISMKNEEQKPSRDRDYLTPKNFGNTRASSQSPGKNGQDDLHEKYSSLKNELQDLHRQRQQIINEMSTSKKGPSGNIKKLIVLIVFIFIGIFLGNKVESLVEQRRLKEEQERKMQESSKPWRLFGFLDFLYDEVDPENL